MNVSTDRRNRAWRWAARGLFLMEALTLALVLPRMPDLKDALRLSPSGLGFALLGMPCGALVGFLFAPATVRRAGLRATSCATVAFLAVAFVLPTLARSGGELFLAFAVVGLGVTHAEIALNGQAAAYERATGHGMMASCHGFWSIGSICGVLTGGFVARLGVAPEVQTVATAIVLIAGTGLAAAALPAVQRPATRPMVRGAAPVAVLVPVCLMPIGVIAIEGVFMDWSAVFMRSVLLADPFEAALAFAVFTAAMTVVRLAGDRLVARFGPNLVIAPSAVAAGAGILLFGTADDLVSALLGAAVAGAGAANVYPIALSVAAKMPGEPERNIAVVSFSSFLLLLGILPAFGLAVEHLGYRAAFAVVAALAVPTFVLGLQGARQSKRARPIGDAREANRWRCVGQNSTWSRSRPWKW